MTDIELLNHAIDNAEKLLTSLKEFRESVAGITKLREEHAELSADLARIKRMLEAA